MMIKWSNGYEMHRPCDRCRRLTKQVRDADCCGWYCTRCMQFHADPVTTRQVVAVFAIGAVLLLALYLATWAAGW